MQKDHLEGLLMLFLCFKVTINLHKRFWYVFRHHVGERSHGCSLDRDGVKMELG